MGRTLPIWNTFGRVKPFTPQTPWLLRFFDQVRLVHSNPMQCGRSFGVCVRTQLLVKPSSCSLSHISAAWLSLYPHVCGNSLFHLMDKAWLLRADLLLRGERGGAGGAARAVPHRPPADQDRRRGVQHEVRPLAAVSCLI